MIWGFLLVACLVDPRVDVIAPGASANPPAEQATDLRSIAWRDSAARVVVTAQRAGSVAVTSELREPFAAHRPPRLPPAASPPNGLREPFLPRGAAVSAPEPAVAGPSGARGPGRSGLREPFSAA